MTFARLPIGRIPRLHGTASLVAFGSIIGVPLLAACFPRWAGRVTMPLLAVTSIGVYLTVPDTEQVRVVMVVMVAAAIVCLTSAITPHPIVVAAAAFVIMGTAITDSGGRGAAIARATGCFGVLLAAPVAGWLSARATKREVERRPAVPMLVIVHCVAVGWSSRALIRETAVDRVVAASGAALLIATVLLFATARPAAVPS